MDLVKSNLSLYKWANLTYTPVIIKIISKFFSPSTKLLATDFWSDAAAKFLRHMPLVVSGGRVFVKNAYQDQKKCVSRHFIE